MSSIRREGPLQGPGPVPPGEGEAFDAEASAQSEVRAAVQRGGYAGSGRAEVVASIATSAAQGVARADWAPDWVPADFDLSALARSAREILESQGEPADSIGPGQASRLLFSDADLTLLKTSLPVFLKDPQTGELLRHPETGEVLLLGIGPDKDQRKDLAELRERFPDFDWGEPEFDYRAYDSVREIMRTEDIPATTAELRRSDQDPKSRDFMVTARNGESVAGGLERYLGERGLDPNGLFVVNSSHAQKLGLTDPDLSSGQMKALTIAGLVSLYESGAGELETVRVLDDGDKNLVASMEILPRLYPKVDFEFIDVVHRGDGVHEHEVIARSGASSSGLVDAHGQALSKEAIAGYGSQDALYEPDPRFNVSDSKEHRS